MGGMSGHSLSVGLAQMCACIGRGIQIAQGVENLTDSRIDHRGVGRSCEVVDLETVAEITWQLRSRRTQDRTPGRVETGLAGCR